jgi:hypothetical protein
MRSRSFAALLVLDQKLRRITPMDELIEDMARAILKTRWYDCEPDAYDSPESFLIEIDPDHWIDARDEARAALAAIHARGDWVVPGVATGRMVTAAIDHASPNMFRHPSVAYPAMLSASPYAPEETK